jgi:DNA-binding transcriptional MocR family regulator
MHLETLAFALDNYDVSAVFTIANFHNPTGSLMSDAKKAELVRMLSAREIPLIEDDVYGDLHFGDDRPRPCKAFDTDGTVLYCSSFSKTISPGLRVGWIEPGRWYSEIESLKMQINLGAASVPQVATTLFLKDGGFARHLRRLRGEVAFRARSLRASVLAHFPEGTTVSDPAGGMVLWVSLPDGVSSRELYRLALDRKIMIAPGHVFSLQNRFESQLRLNAGVWENSTDAKIEILGNLAKSLRDKTVVA